ncbi:MAG: hypothetical protein RL148_3170 [Planctomycetota bacterium]
MTAKVAYLCADPGIGPDGTKGASVHFRSLAAAFARIGTALDVTMVRPGDTSVFAPHECRVVPVRRARGLEGELHQLGHGSVLLDTLAAAGPHAAVYERLSLFSCAGLAHARRSGIPFVLEVNAPLWQEAAEFRTLHLHETAKALCMDVVRGADAVFAVSAPLARQLTVLGADPKRVHVMGNGADLEAFRSAVPATRPAALAGKPLLLFAGSLKPWHGIEFLVRAFGALRKKVDCGLWVVGDGPGRETLERASAGLDGAIVCEGAVSHERMPSLLAAADAVLAPYPAAAPEFFSPLKVVEALAARRPLVASRVPCVLGELDGCELPGLHAPDDVDDFVGAVQRVLARPDKALPPDVLVARLDWVNKARRILASLLPGKAPAEVSVG